MAQRIKEDKRARRKEGKQTNTHGCLRNRCSRMVRMVSWRPLQSVVGKGGVIIFDVSDVGGIRTHGLSRALPSTAHRRRDKKLAISCRRGTFGRLWQTRGDAAIHGYPTQPHATWGAHRVQYARCGSCHLTPKKHGKRSMGSNIPDAESSALQ